MQRCALLCDAQIQYMFAPSRDIRARQQRRTARSRTIVNLMQAARRWAWTSGFRPTSQWRKGGTAAHARWAGIGPLAGSVECRAQHGPRFRRIRQCENPPSRRLHGYRMDMLHTDIARIRVCCASTVSLSVVCEKQEDLEDALSRATGSEARVSGSKVRSVGSSWLSCY